jgi:hypothetical protein
VINRRGFLGLLAGVAATAVLDPDRLLWVPGAKTISIPAPRVFTISAADLTIPGWTPVAVLSDDIQTWLNKFTDEYFAESPSPVEHRREVVTRFRSWTASESLADAGGKSS